MALPPAYAVVTVSGRGTAALDAFCARVPSARRVAPVAAAASADLVLLTVPDDALPPLVDDLARTAPLRPGVRCVHTAGGYGAGVLEPLRAAGARIAACHPAQTFPHADDARLRLPGVAWAVTAGDEDMAWACALVQDLGGVAVPVNEDDRPLYHAALSVASNATTVIIALARDLLCAAGAPDPGRFLAPLVSASTDNAVREGAAALTGAVRRGDAGTVARHIAALRDAFPSAVPVYVAVSRLAVRYAQEHGLAPEAAQAVRAVLESA